MTGTFINVAAVLAGTGIGLGAGTRLTERLQQRVLAGLGMVTLVIGVDLALAWGRDDTTAQTPIYVLGAILLGGLAGEPVSNEGPLRVELGALGRRLSLGSAALDLLLVAALVLMIWQPGG